MYCNGKVKEHDWRLFERKPVLTTRYDQLWDGYKWKEYPSVVVSGYNELWYCTVCTTEQVKYSNVGI